MVEISVPFIHLMQLGVKMISHRIQQYRSTTNETIVLPTSYGQVKGVKRKTIYNHYFYAFEGIPYAKPPIGELRFRAPEPPEPWTDVRNCTNFGYPSLQKHFILGITHGAEDCLTLNVYAKKLKTDKPLPVMVWLHGGGFQIGEATRDLYAPDYFMERDVVLVTVSYRLGALGFLSLRDPDLQVPGNAGLKDQLLALRWVQANIANFNGDPHNVTLFGESAGGASVHLLMLAPKAKGLFHKSILQSGAALCPWTESQLSGEGPLRLANALGYTGGSSDKEIFRFLCNTDGWKIVNAQNNLLLPQEERERFWFAFSPVVEPYESKDSLLTKPFKDLLITAWSNEIPSIMGVTSHEGLFHYAETKLKPHLVNELDDFVTMLPSAVRNERDANEHKELAQQIKKAHFGEKEPHHVETLTHYLEMLSYRHFVIDIHRTVLARMAYASNVPTYLYHFALDSPHFNHYRILNCGKSVRGVSHADDISYIFYNVNANKLPTESAEYKTIQRMIGMWTAFAAKGDPNCAEILPVQWQAVVAKDAEQAQPKCLNIDENVEFLTFPKEKLPVWQNLYTNNSLY